VEELGLYEVRFIGPAFFEARNLCRETFDRMALRDHLRKLEHWEHDDVGGLAVDLDWFWIRDFKELRLAEVLIDDELGGHADLRAVVFVPTEAYPYARDGKRVIWVLSVLDKQDDQYTLAETANLWLRRKSVQRYYERESAGEYERLNDLTD
jgi:hypothetical protein